MFKASTRVNITTKYIWYPLGRKIGPLIFMCGLCDNKFLHSLLKLYVDSLRVRKFPRLQICRADVYIAFGFCSGLHLYIIQLFISFVLITRMSHMALCALFVITR